MNDKGLENNLGGWLYQAPEKYFSDADFLDEEKLQHILYGVFIEHEGVINASGFEFIKEHYGADYIAKYFFSHHSSAMALNDFQDFVDFFLKQEEEATRSPEEAIKNLDSKYDNT